MAGLLIPLMLLLLVIMGVLGWALYTQLRDIDLSSESQRPQGIRPAARPAQPARSAPPPGSSPGQRAPFGVAPPEPAAAAPLATAASSSPPPAPSMDAASPPPPPAPPRRPARAPSTGDATPGGGLLSRIKGSSAPRPSSPSRRPRRQCATCGGSGRAIIHSPTGLKHGPCPDCRG